MAMLAGPRKKQKVINLRAKNNAWSNDSQKFGQRMLEKMGWSSGKGLGARENGIVEHVIARYKNDEKGLGFEDKNDQWTKHEDDFNSLLSNLTNATDTEGQLHSGVSLEKKSKTSKARIHYHKFTRGKDLSRYSEKDLANIFGKKALKNNVPQETAPLKHDIKTTEQVFTEKGSMEDYFKTKMAGLKSKNKQISPSFEVKEECGNDYAFQGFSGAGDSVSEKNTSDICFQPFSFNNNDKNSIKTAVSRKKIPEVPKTIKKSKKKGFSMEASDATSTVDNQVVINNLENEEVKIENHEVCKKLKKSKKRKNKERNEADSENEDKKIYDAEITLNVVEEKVGVENDNFVPKKKKKKKNKDK